MYFPISFCATLAAIEISCHFTRVTNKVVNIEILLGITKGRKACKFWDPNMNCKIQSVINSKWWKTAERQKSAI